jgi:ribosome biogenesis GTPase A
MHGLNMERQVWWNFVPNTEEQLIDYFIVIINDSREIKKIQSRVITKLAPVDELRETAGPADNLRYKILSFISNRKIESWEFKRIYDGKVKRDERLYERQNGFEGLERYVIGRLAKMTD